MSEDSEFSKPPTLGRVAVVGLGLIGGSIGLALASAHAANSIAGWDPNSETLSAALSRGAITEVCDGPEEVVIGADLVVICAPIPEIVPLVRQIAASLGPSTVVTDVGSAKGRIVREADDIIGGAFIGGHPMAGSELSGISAASPHLFRQAAWAITQTDNSEMGALDRVVQLAGHCGSHTVFCSPAEHDEYIAYFSHLPHILAYGLSKSAGHPHIAQGAELAAGSFRDGTRVAKSDPEQWAEILLENRAYAAEALGSFLGWSSRVRGALVRGDRDALANLLADAHRARMGLPK